MLPHYKNDQTSKSNYNSSQNEVVYEIDHEDGHSGNQVHDNAADHHVIIVSGGGGQYRF
jgi:hypothetical protein